MKLNNKKINNNEINKQIDIVRYTYIHAYIHKDIRT